MKKIVLHLLVDGIRYLGVWQQRAEVFALIFFWFFVFLPRMQFSVFYCPLHSLPKVGFGFTSPVCVTILLLKSVPQS